MIHIDELTVDMREEIIEDILGAEITQLTISEIEDLYNTLAYRCTNLSVFEDDRERIVMMIYEDGSNTILHYQSDNLYVDDIKIVSPTKDKILAILGEAEVQINQEYVIK